MLAIPPLHPPSAQRTKHHHFAANGIGKPLYLLLAIVLPPPSPLSPPTTAAMSLTMLPRRAAARSAPWIRQFSTVVDDTFSQVAPSGGPPAPPQPRKGSVLEDAVNAKAPRFDWTKDEIREIYNTPLMELAFQSVGAWLWKWYG